MKKMIELGCVLALTGCAGLQPPPVGDAAADAAKLRSEGVPAPKLTIAVVPRIGLFNESQYAVAPDGISPDSDMARWTEDVYMRQIVPELRKLFPPVWKILATGGDSGYAARQVKISAAAPAGVALDCKWEVSSPDGVWRQKFDACTAPVALGNGRFELAGTITARTASGASRQWQAKEQIPADHLIVSIGDSFASGEGNPDRPQREVTMPDSYGASDNAALWLDERCHRSAWAGPIRAALSLMKDKRSQVERADGLAVETSGAYTIASFACSGATLDKGVLGRYDGRVALSSLAAKDPRVKVGLRHYFQKHLPLDPQIAQVVQFLDSQRKDIPGWAPKQVIDTVTVSVGGNDIYFANLVSSMLLERFDSDKDKQELDAMMTRSVTQLNSGTNGYPSLNDALRPCGRERCREVVPPAASQVVPARLDARQILITAYPDPTRHKAECKGNDCYCSGPISKGFYGFLMELFNFKIRAEESELARTKVLDRLNGSVTAAATQYGWKLVSHDEQLFAEHGWCRNKKFGQPYVNAETWFRDAEDSDRYQGDFYGVMHPSWEGHESYMRGIHRVLADTPADDAIRIEPEAGSTSAQSGRTFYRPPFRMCVKTKQGGPREFLVKAGSREHAPDADGCVSLAGNGAPGELMVQDKASGKWFDAAFSSLVVDDLSPSVSCSVSFAGPRRRQTMDCSGLVESTWFRDESVTLTMMAKDSGAGLASTAEVAASHDRGATPGSIKTLDGQVTVGRFPQGATTVRLSAVDRVGNPPTVRSVKVQLDSTAPRATALQAWGARIGWGEGGSMTIPGVKGRDLQLDAELEEADSGLDEVSWSGLTAGFQPTEKAGTWQVTGRVKNLRSEFSALLNLRDVAGNGAVPGQVRVMAIVQNKGAALGVAEWQRSMAGPNAHKALVKKARSLGAERPSDAAGDTPDWQVYSAWLNLADGRLPPDAPVTAAIDGACRVSSGTDVAPTLFGFLIDTRRCLMALPEANRGAFLGEVGAILAVRSP